MPHFGLMNEDKMTCEEAELLRSRLHIRGGRRRLLEGKVNDGLVTLYDALSHGLRYYELKQDPEKETREDEGELHQQELSIARQLVHSGVLDDLNFVTRFCSIVDQAIDGIVPHISHRELLNSLDEIMTKLGVMPFSEDELPPEDPDTF